jgi:hypothetical protein
MELPDDQIGFGFKPILLDFFREQPWTKRSRGNGSEKVPGKPT